ncbi:MAG TPA: protein kinase, partial [Myxococcota bacterium]|nr:protein kinase [Myxococcota bacterium]
MTQGRCLADRFWVLETIDASGATELCLARDAELGEQVALRLLGAALAGHWEALRDACRETRPLAHPHIARVFDFHRAGGAPFICREYVAGARIVDLAAESAADRLGALAQVAAALEAAHARGVVHGDLKASKILRDERGAIRVTDFRVAATLRAATSQTPRGAHASPQVRGGESPAAADDVYSLGVLTAQLLASEPLPRELGALLDAMRASARSARPHDLEEIR